MPRARAAHSSSRRGLSLFRIAGIDIRLDYSWFLIFGLILLSLVTGYFPHRLPGRPPSDYWIASAIATLLFFASIVMHELSHAITARLAGIRVSGITLFLFGGVSELEDDARSPGVELRVAIVGPL